MRVAVRINTLLQGEHTPSQAELSRYATVASLSDIDSISLQLPDKDANAWLKSAQLAMDVFDGPVIVECTAGSESLDILDQLRPDMVVLTGATSTLTSDELVGSALRDMCQALRTSGIDYALHVDANLTLVKAARQVEANAVLLPVSQLVKLRGTDEAVQFMDALESASIGADRLGMRVLLEGDLDRTAWAAFSTNDLIEGVIAGPALVQRALLLGLGSAVRELKSIR